MQRKQHGGYTLIEVLIALAIFAILGTISVGLLGRSFDTSARLKAQLDPLAELQLAVARMSRDITQVVDRGRLSFIGQVNYAEFVRGGIVVPDENEAKSTLKRVALVCGDDERLVRKTWARVYPVNLEDFQEQALMHEIESCEFSYLDKNSDNTWVSEWPMPTTESSKNAKEKSPSFPRAIKLTLRLKNLGDIPLIFMIPGGA
ncbi:MAG: type II secretion system minor pseudopilin GspJ [Legionellaceae bacterium]|nr:type II secretion system minor pseudopilin GspJ [Legionellaceae bacterium]